jgi:hypothetical protein
VHGEGAGDDLPQHLIKLADEEERRGELPVGADDIGCGHDAAHGVVLVADEDEVRVVVVVALRLALGNVAGYLTGLGTRLPSCDTRS